MTTNELQDLDEWNCKWNNNLCHCAHKSINKAIHLITQNKSHWNTIFCTSISNLTRYHIFHQLISCQKYSDKIRLTLLILWIQIIVTNNAHVNMCTSVPRSDKILKYYSIPDTFIRIGINYIGNVCRTKFQE